MEEPPPKQCHIHHLIMYRRNFTQMCPNPIHAQNISTCTRFSLLNARPRRVKRSSNRPRKMWFVTPSFEFLSLAIFLVPAEKRDEINYKIFPYKKTRHQIIYWHRNPFCWSTAASALQHLLHQMTRIKCAGEFVSITFLLLNLPWRWNDGMVCWLCLLPFLVRPDLSFPMDINPKAKGFKYS